MSSFLIPLTDALAPQALATELPQSATGLPAGVNAPFQDLFPELLAGLAASLDGDPLPRLQNPKPGLPHLEFPAAEGGRRLCQPASLLQHMGSEQTTDNLDPLLPGPLPAGVDFLRLPSPMWTAPTFAVLDKANSIDMEESPEENHLPDEANAQGTNGAQSTELLPLPHSPLPVPAESLPVAGSHEEPARIASGAEPEVFPEVHVDPPDRQVPLSVERGSRKNGDSEGEQSAAKVPPDSVLPLTLPPASPEKPPLMPVLPALESRGVDGATDHRAENRPHASGQDDSAQPSTKTDRRAFSEEGESPAAREAFRLLLRNYSGNSAATATMPVVKDMPHADVSSSETAPIVTKLPAPARDRPEGGEAVPQHAELFRPPVAKAPTPVAGPRKLMNQVLPEANADKSIAAQTETSSVAPEPKVSRASDMGRRQGDGNSQGREEDGPARSSANPESTMKPVMLPAREFSTAAADPRRVALPADAGIATSPQTVTATEEQAPLVPSSRTVQQIRVTLSPSTEGRNVEVLLHQKAGGVEVSVRSPDPQVRETLRSGLSDLIGSFDRKGVVAETLPVTITGHLPQAGQTQGLAEAGAAKALSAQTAVETTDREMRDDTQQHQQRQTPWQPEGDNRRRRDQSAEAWQKYMEENAWRSQ